MMDTPKKQRRKRKTSPDQSPELPSQNKSEEEKVEVEVPKKKRGRKKKIIDPPPVVDPEEDSDLQRVFRLVENLMGSSASEAFLQRPDDSMYGMSDYYDIVTKPMWLKEVERKYKAKMYSTPTELVADIRLMLENCYHYWGPSDTLSKRALKLEQMFENKLNSLPEDLQSRCSLEATHGDMVKDEPDDDSSKQTNCNESQESIGKRSKNSNIYQNKVNTSENKKGGGYNSKLLNWVINGRGRSDGETDKSLSSWENLTKTELALAEKQLSQWETEHLLRPGVLEQIASMWEFPVIGQFLHLVYNVLNIDTISQLELERMLLIPQASKTLATLMTSMLIPPLFRAKLEVGPAMPYSIWTKRLNVKIASWYRNYRSKGDSTIEVFDSLGVEPQFWLVMGEENPLKDYAFHELTFLQRVWLLKGLCDFLLHNHKTIQDCINNLEMVELREQNLGMDKDGYSYHYFPMFKEVRIYKMAKVSDTKWKGYEAGVEEAMTLCAEEVDEDDPSAEDHFIGYSRRPPHKPPRSMRPSHKDFKLVCQSLDDVRSLIDRFCNADPKLLQSQGASARLVTRLQRIVNQLESRESKMELEVLSVRSRMRDEWTRHKDRSASYDDPGTAYWERKEKEEKRAVEEKDLEMSIPGTSHDSATEDEKRERRSRRESSLKMIAREENGLVGDDSEEESPLDFDDNSEDEWFATKKDKENKKKKRCMSAKKLKKLANAGEKNQHSTPAKDKSHLKASACSKDNSSVKVSGNSEPLVKVKEEPCDPDETSSQLKDTHQRIKSTPHTPIFQDSSNYKDNKGEPIVCKQEMIDKPQPPPVSSAPSNVIQSLVRPVSNVKLEKAGKTIPIAPDLSSVKRSNSPESEVVYISDSEDTPDIKPNPVILAKQLSSNKLETINFAMMGVPQQAVGNYLITNTVQNPPQFLPVNVIPGDQVFNAQPQVFNITQPPGQPIPYQIPPAQNIVQQPVIRPNPGIVRLQGQPRPNITQNQKFVVLQNNANVNQANQFTNKGPQGAASNFPTTPTMQTVNWFGSRGSPQPNVNYSPRQRGQSPRGRGSPQTPTRGSPRFSGRTPPNTVRTPGSMLRTPSQVGARTPSPMRGRGAVPHIRPGPVRNLNFNRSPSKPVNKPSDLPTNDTPDIEGTLVVSLTDSGGFGYVVMLADGGKISLTQDQLAKIRSDNGGTLPKTCKVPLNMQTEGFRID